MIASDEMIKLRHFYQLLRLSVLNSRASVPQSLLLLLTVFLTFLGGPPMTRYKSIFIAIGLVLGILMLLAFIKGSQFAAMGNSAKNMPEHTEAVNTFPVEEQTWPNVFTAIGTIEADEGINISAEVPGKVKQILFKSGERVKAGTVVLIQESGNEAGQLSAATARLRLADANYLRMVQLHKKNTVSQNELDTALQQKESAQGDVDNLKTTLNKKVVKAPFDGRLGIRKADLGQDLQVGAVIVSLQATNRVRVNFPVPQFWLSQMSKGLPVSVNLGDGSNTSVKGEVTAVGADINVATRSATVQSSLENASNQLIPGMAVQVQVSLANPQTVLSVPATAIIFAPFGDTLYTIEKDKAGKLVAKQQFVRLGRSRGDFVEIIDGLKKGDVVVSAGAFKLFNGQGVTISKNSPPEFKTDPTPTDS
jgi:membrane fusion protein, multidrug efflux system